MVIVLILMLDAKMRGLACTGKRKEISQGDLEGIGRENCKIGIGL